MAHDYSDDRLRLAARLYYADGLGQHEVAKFVKVSQAKVSRLLALARERGIVRISIADYETRRPDLEKQLQDRFPLSAAIVLKAIDGLTDTDLRRSVGYFGAPLVDALIPPRAIVALAGGRTLYELVQRLPESRDRALTVIQAMGSVDSNANAFDAQEVGRVLVQRLGGTFLAFNTPAFTPDKRTRDTLLKLEQIRHVREHLDRANLAMVGVGTLENSVFIERGVLTPGDLNELRKAGAVGETCGRFFNDAGAECATSWRDRVMSADLEQLRRMPQSIAVVSGSDRSAALIAAIRGKLIKGLVIDESGAIALLSVERPRATTRVARAKK